jgi:hypothetical protein
MWDVWPTLRLTGRRRASPGADRAFCGFLRALDPAAETDPWTAFGDYLPYAIAFQLMPAWGERFAMLTPPGHLGADRFWSDASWVSGNNLTWAGALAGFTTAVCSHVPPAGPPSHHGGSDAGHAGAFGHHGGHGGHDGHGGHFF